MRTLPRNVFSAGFILSLLTVLFSSLASSARERTDAGALVGLGYGHLTAQPLRQSEELLGPREQWSALTFDIGGHTRAGDLHYGISFLFSRSEFGGPAGLAWTNQGELVPVHHEMAFAAFTGFLRLKLWGPLMLDLSGGILSEDHVVKADDPGVGGSFSHGDEPFPLVGGGLGLDLPGRGISRPLILLRVFSVLPKEGFTPDWDLWTLSLNLKL